MNIDQLKYLADLAVTNSMNVTAKRMFISQQAVSDSIKRLEHELGCTLLIRSKTGITFTEDGKAILEHAQKILNHYSHITQYLEEKYNKDYVDGKLLIGAGPVVNDTILPSLLLRMHNKFPNISIHVVSNTIETIIKMLKNKELDFIIFSYSQNDHYDFRNVNLEHAEEGLKNYYVKRLYTDAMVCVMPNNHPLSVQETVTFADMEHYKQTIYSNDSSLITNSEFLHVSTNLKIHQQFIKTEGTICSIPLSTYMAMSPTKEYTCKFITDAAPVTFYLIYHKDTPAQKMSIYQDFVDAAVSLCQYG